MSDLRRDLLTAMKARNYTFRKLKELCGLNCEASSLIRKLNGGQPLSAEEALAIGGALGVKTSGISRLSKLAEEMGAEVSWPVSPRKGVA